MKTEGTKLIEVKWLGRGGQGAVTASNILATAAYLDGYKGVQAFPFFGMERREAPVSAFTRLSDREVRARHLVYEPDVIIVLDPLLAKQIDVATGIKKNGYILLNIPRETGKVYLKGDFNVATVDALSIAEELNLKVAGMPVYNTPMLGAFSKVTNLVRLDSVKRAIIKYFGVKRGEVNVKAAEMAYKRTVIEGSSACSNPEGSCEAGEDPEIESLRDLPTSPMARPAKASIGAPTGGWRTFRPVLNEEKCEKCMLCWLYCPDGVISVGGDGYPLFDYEYCKGCGICAYECRSKAIELVKEA